MLFIVFLRELKGLLASFNIFNLSAIIFVCSLGVIALISHFTTAPAEAEIESTLWRVDMLRPTKEELALGYPLWKRIGFWFTLVVLCFMIIYAIFW
jgi:hypothetical protein